VGLNLISSKLLDGNGFKPMPGLISCTQFGFNVEKNTGSQMEHNKKSKVESRDNYRGIVSIIKKVCF